MKLSDCKDFDTMKKWSRLEKAWLIRGDELTEASSIRPYFDKGEIKARVHVFFELDGRIVTDMHVSELYSTRKEAEKAAGEKKKGQIFQVLLHFINNEWVFKVTASKKTSSKFEGVGKVSSMNNPDYPEFEDFFINVDSVNDVEKAMAALCEEAEKWLSGTIGSWKNLKKEFLKDKPSLLVNGANWPEFMKKYGQVFPNCEE